MNNDIKLINGDAVREIKKIPSESIDLIIADPPYNVGKDYGNNSDSQSKKEYLDFSQKWLNEAYRVLKPNGTIYIFMGIKYISHIHFILEEKMFLNNWICWHYTQGIGKKRGFSPRHDDILMFIKSKQFTFNLDKIRVPQKYYRKKNNMRGANPGDVWEFSHIHYCQKGRVNHPTQKPEAIIERLILASSNKNDLILDPFAGSGTTLRVCQQLERKCIGIEISEEYINVIKDRLKNKFNGFDSIDPKMKRIPKDLNDKDIKDEYLKNHKKWFLKNHENIETTEDNYRNNRR